MRFRVLGPVEVDTMEGPLPLPCAQDRLLLAVLLLAGGEPVSAGRLVDVLWADEPPADARRVLHDRVTRLGELLESADSGAVALVRGDAEYRLRLTDPDAVDATAFRLAMRRAGRLADPAQRATESRAALDLWLGDALHGTAPRSVAEQLTGDLSALRWSAIEDLRGLHPAIWRTGLPRVRLLGPVEVWAGGALLDIGSAKPRLVLAALAASAGRSVPLSVLVDRIWGTSPPRDPAASLYPYISHLRRALRPAGVDIVRRDGGYACELPAELVDATRFRSAVAEAKKVTGDTTGSYRAIMLLDEALGLWRDEPLAGAVGDWVDSYRVTLRQDRIAASVLWAEHHQRLGKLADVADEVLEASGEYPLSERLAGLAIEALALAGRRAEALDQYARVRGHLAETLGEEPGDDLRQLHLRLLRRDPPTSGPKHLAVPRQLPPVTRHFVGRTAELRRLDTVAKSAGPGTTAVAAITGTGGVGKTATALRWAHRVAGEFPDGQFYVNLRGFDPAAEPMEPVDALRGFLIALGLSSERIPAGTDAAAALFRSLVADRRVLIVLDNARDVDQVRPLLPGAPGCAAVVTSRNRMTGLVAEHGATPVLIDLLSHHDAVDLVARHVGRERAATDPAATAALVECCARLPLALAVAASRAAQDPALPLPVLVTELTDSRRRLDALDTDDPATTVRAVFSWSYAALTPPQRRMFRLLGLAPGADISLRAASNLAGTAMPETARLLAKLTRANLVSEHTPGRYGLHDLLRAYAHELATIHDSTLARDAAVHQVLDHYMVTATAAKQLLMPHREPRPLPDLLPGVTPAPVADRDEALAWFDAERRTLTDAVHRAAEVGLDDHAWILADALGTFLEGRGHWLDWFDILRVGQASAERSSPGANATVHRNLGLALGMVGRHADARLHLTTALDLSTASDDKIGAAEACFRLGYLAELEDDLPEAQRHGERALDLYRAADNEIGTHRALTQLAWYQALAERWEPARLHSSQALDAQSHGPDRIGRAISQDVLGYVLHHLGDQDQAVALFRQARETWRALGERYLEAWTLRQIGDAHRDAGDRPAAREVWRLALGILVDLAHPEAVDLQARLA